MGGAKVKPVQVGVHQAPRPVSEVGVNGSTEHQNGQLKVAPPVNELPKSLSNEMRDLVMRMCQAFLTGDTKQFNPLLDK